MEQWLLEKQGPYHFLMHCSSWAYRIFITTLVFTKQAGAFAGTPGACLLCTFPWVAPVGQSQPQPHGTQVPAVPPAVPCLEPGPTAHGVLVPLCCPPGSWPALPSTSRPLIPPTSPHPSPSRSFPPSHVCGLKAPSPCNTALSACSSGCHKYRNICSPCHLLQSNSFFIEMSLNCLRIY